MNRKAIAGATVALVVGTMTLVPPGSALASSAGGPTTVCSNFAGVSETLPPQNSVSEIFAYDGVFLLNGELNQNAYEGINTHTMTWVIQQANDNYILIGARNNQSSSWPVSGWIIEQWVCS
jgi:hypothetical protein